MGLISASSLGQPINKNKYNKINNSKNIINSNVSTKRIYVISNTMAPALTTESSAEHRKRSLSNDAKNCPKLDSDSFGRQLRQGGIDDGVITATTASMQGKCTTEQPGKQNEDEDATLKVINTTDDAGERSFLREAEEVLGHNVDEILQVLESMEAGGKCGTGSGSGEESMLRLLGSDLELLEAGPDMAGLCMSSSQEIEQPPSPIPQPQQVPTEERLAESSSRQHVLERRCERLMRRARKLQARGTAKHAAQHVQDLVTSARALLKARNASHRSHAATQQANKDTLLDSESVKNMSAAALVSLVKKISGGPPLGTGLAQALSPDQAATLRDGSSALQFRLRHVEGTFDSDVTASSSGGDSCDEAAGFNNNHTGTAPICKRAAWRFARERASVVGRWTWLQANISDLEYRIRQYSECHRQLRANKGAIRLADPPCSTSKQPRPGEEGSLVVNGFHADAAPGSSSNAGEGEVDSACRTRPLDLSEFKRRKLVVPGVMLPKSGKRCFPSHNQPPCCRDSFSMPCILCFSKRATVVGSSTGRELASRESCRERAARLDPAVHASLSASADISRGLHMAAQLRQPSWQQTQLRQRGLARLGLGLKRSKAAANSDPLAALTAPPRRKYTTHKKNNTANALSAKIRRKAKARKRHRGRPAADSGDQPLERYKRHRRLQRHSLGSSEGGYMEGDLDLATPSSSQSSGARRKRESSYDIDNIVIPYSMAALTRVEKLEYKEIPTPKWRVAELLTVPRKPLVSSKNGVVRTSPENEEGETEDISDAAILARHETLELEERKKFRSPKPSSRGLRARRTDSRAESSGANTPDPMSPNTAGGEVGDSPLASPRATPLPPSMLVEEGQSSSAKPGTSGSKPLSAPQALSALGYMRRRTVSYRPPSPELLGPPPEVVPPFELRSFPLTEENFQQMVAGGQVSYHARDVVASRPAASPPPPGSPCGTDSTESALPEEDEELDPEWTAESEAPPATLGTPQSTLASSAALACAMVTRSNRKTL